MLPEDDVVIVTDKGKEHRIPFGMFSFEKLAGDFRATSMKLQPGSLSMNLTSSYPPKTVSKRTQS